MKSETKNSKSELIFYNPRILDSDANPYRPIKELTRVGIFRAIDLIVKTRQRNYNRNVFLKIKEIKDCVKTLQNDQPVTQECLLIIRLEGKLVPFSKVMVRSVYQELQKENVYNESYKQKCETTVKDTLGGGGELTIFLHWGVLLYGLYIDPFWNF